MFASGYSCFALHAAVFAGALCVLHAALTAFCSFTYATAHHVHIHATVLRVSWSVDTRHVGRRQNETIVVTNDGRSR